MLRGLFPRLFGQFREGGIIRGRFTFEDDDDSWSASSDSYVGFTAADAGTGLVTITFPKCRNMSVLHAEIHNPTPGTAANHRVVELSPITTTIAQAGSMSIALHDLDTAAATDPVDGAVLEMVLYCDK